MPATLDELSLHKALSRLWTDHVVWTRLYVLAALAGSEDASAAAGRLLKNQEDIGNALVPFYGDAAGKAVGELLKQHILIAVDLVDAALKGDGPAFDAADQRWDDNAAQIAAVVSSVNPDNWPEKDVHDLLKLHLDLTRRDVVARLDQDWEGDVAAFDDIHTEILTVADVLASGIVKQFPNMFNGAVAGTSGAAGEAGGNGEKSLYERLGGVFAIAAVVDHFSNAIVENSLVGQGSGNRMLNEWHTEQLVRLPGLKFMRTLWVCNVAGGPFEYSATKPGATPVGLEEAHRDLKISSEEFDEVAAELERSLIHFGVPEEEKGQVLGAFAAHKGEVTEGSRANGRAKHAAAPGNADKSLYERLGGVFAIAAVVDHFSNAIVENSFVGQGSNNRMLHEWHTEQLAGRLPGLKFMRTLWVCNVAGGPFEYSATKPGATPVGLEEAHRDLKISSEEFDEVAAELERSLIHFGVPEEEKGQVLGAFAAHKGEVTEGSKAATAATVLRWR